LLTAKIIKIEIHITIPADAIFLFRINLIITGNAAMNKKIIAGIKETPGLPLCAHWESMYPVF
jgi:hypothetical protein